MKTLRHKYINITTIKNGVNVFERLFFTWPHSTAFYNDPFSPIHTENDAFSNVSSFEIVYENHLISVSDCFSCRIGEKTHWFGQELYKNKEWHNRQWRLRLSDSSIFDISFWSVAKNSTLLKVKAENFPIFVVLPLWIGHGNGNKTVKFGWDG